MRKCGFRDCNNQIKWKEEVCEECYDRKENFKCDACLQDAGYNLVLLGRGAIRDFVNDTEIMLQRTRKMFDKIPSLLHHLLKEMEQSLILTEEEKKAEAKNRNLRIEFLLKKNQDQRRDNLHSFKLCQDCFDELAQEEKNLFENNSDVKKIAEKWDKNGKDHLRIFKEFDRELGEERFKQILEELEQEVKEEFTEEDKDSNKNKNQSNDKNKSEVEKARLAEEARRKVEAEKKRREEAEKKRKAEEEERKKRLEEEQKQREQKKLREKFLWGVFIFLVVFTVLILIIKIIKMIKKETKN